MFMERYLRVKTNPIYIKESEEPFNVFEDVDFMNVDCYGHGFCELINTLYLEGKVVISTLQTQRIINIEYLSLSDS